jgi:arginine deiminase
VPGFNGVDSEVGRLRSVIVRRPGAELAPGLVVTHERNVATLATLERCGIESITVPGSELYGPRGGPRSLCCPVSRAPASLPPGLRTELSGCAQRSCLASGRQAR